jgi:predicted enzyme related to lactoylglutathione lyase
MGNITAAIYLRRSTEDNGKPVGHNGSMNIGYVNLYVDDLDAATSFYAGQLGFKLHFRDDDHSFASFDAGPVSLGIAAIDSSDPDQMAMVGGLRGVGIVVDDLDAEHQRLASLGVAFHQLPERMPWGGYLALIEDPAGNILYLDEASAAHPD